MTATLAYERLIHYNGSFPYEQIQSAYGKSYYKLYQLKLRQLLTANTFRHEDQTKQKQLNDKRSSQEYVNHLRDRIKSQTLNEDHGKRTTSVLSIAKRRMKDSMTYTITSTEATTISTIVPSESRPKSILKTKQSSP
jgi:hypothetical protein